MRTYEALILLNAIFFKDVPHTQYEEVFRGRGVRHQTLQILYSVLEAALKPRKSLSICSMAVANTVPTADAA